MKKLFLLLLFSLFILISWGQNMNKDLNKMKTTISLDGKSYKITLKTSAVQEKNPSKAKSSSSDKTISQSKKTEFAVIDKSQNTDDVEIINGAEMYDTTIIASDKNDILILGQSDDLDIESFSNTTMILRKKAKIFHTYLPVLN